MSNCVNCGKLTVDNYCDSECMIENAKKNGGKVMAPNNLPITCIRYDYTMMEHPEADHPDYKFPVKVEYCGKEIPVDKYEYSREDHALIYTDGNIAVTIYECCFAMWTLNGSKRDQGKCCGGHLWAKNDWKLTDESIEKIRSYANLKKAENHD
jgi:hypothetical protein